MERAYDLCFYCLVVTVVLRISGQDPCSSNTVLDDAWRSSTYIPPNSEPLHCDNGFDTGWYRFTNATISNYCVKTFSCGTYSTLWINSTDDLQTSVQLCQNFNDNCCYWSTMINVRRCPDTNGSFFRVFEIPQLSNQCYFGICTDKVCSNGVAAKYGACSVTRPTTTIPVSPVLSLYHNATDPCITAFNLGILKRSTSYVPPPYETLLTDTSLISNQWYRFNSSILVKIPEHCVEIFHCGTFAPVWMKGSHPTAENPGPKTVPVCAQIYLDNCCGWTKQISVKWCQRSGEEYFVYQLQATPDSYAYCVEYVCGAGYTWNDHNLTCTGTTSKSATTTISPSTSTSTSTTTTRSTTTTKTPSFDTQSTEPSMVATSSITATTNQVPGTTSTSVSNGANSSGAFPVGAIIGISVGAVLIGIAIPIIVAVYIRKRKSKPASVNFISKTTLSSVSEDLTTTTAQEYYPHPTLEIYELISIERNEVGLSRKLDLRPPNIANKDFTNDVPTLSATELKKIRILGSGGYGDVYIAEHTAYGTVAYKETRKPRSSNLKEEANIHRKLRHPNIVKLIAIVSDPLKYQGIVLEYVENGDLLEYIRTHFPDCRFRCSRIKEVCSGMNYLHSLDPPIIHGDLKIENVLLGKHFEAKICDFGYSREKRYSGPNSRNSTLRGTCTHIPPEVWINPYLRRVESYDVYSFGILMWEALAGEKPFNGERSSALIREWILKNLRPDIDKIPQEISENMTKLMKECWGRNAESRPAFKEIEADFINGKYSDEETCCSV